MSIQSELVDDIFTIENIATLVSSVGSKTPAANMLQRQAELWMVSEELDLEAKKAFDCLTDDSIGSNVTMTDTDQARDRTWRNRPYSKKKLVDLTIATRDINLVEFPLRIDQEARPALGKIGDSLHVEPLVRPSHLQFALQKGFMEIAGKMIAANGVGLPLDHLVQKSGIGEVEKPKLAECLFLRAIVNFAPKMQSPPTPSPLMEDCDPGDFIPGEDWDRQRKISKVVETWRICKEAAGRQEDRVTGKLVSVTEAAEVAKRLA
ncbi:hypothetical protein MMC11_000679 [Xylographa trunciseda]|nr:hypothetical protein [Xylographa trunciseda]